MRGLPVVEPARLIADQQELIDRIMDCIHDHKSSAFYTRAVERYASYAHLLPASQSHHHRGAGGLLRHAIEVGLYALQMARSALVHADAPPKQRRMIEPRWQLAVFLAGLCHDAGKPMTDLTVSDEGRSHVWHPVREGVYDWAARNGIRAYYIDWRPGRARRHVNMSVLAVERIIGTDALDWIGEGGIELVEWMMESLTGAPTGGNPLHDLVVRADQVSVERDLSSMGAVMAGYDIGVPVERFLIDLMRRFVREGVWSINEPGARVWSISGRTYLVWPAGGDELAQQVRAERIPGLPRTADGILDMLVERGMVLVQDGSDTPFWDIAPKVLSDKIKGVKLMAVCLRDDAMLSAAPIASVEGVVVAHGRDVRQTADPNSDTRDTSAADDSDERHATAASSAETDPSEPVEFSGMAGEALKALSQDLASGDKRWGIDADVDGNGRVMVRWPEAFSGYGVMPKALLDDLHARGWIVFDPEAPHLRAADAVIGGVSQKVIVLSAEVSKTLLDDSQGRVRPGADTSAKAENSRAAALSIDQVIKTIAERCARYSHDDEEGWRVVKLYRAADAVSEYGINRQAFIRLCADYPDRLGIAGNMVRYR
jgi:conjugal transfer pilus assembly protein TraI